MIDTVDNRCCCGKIWLDYHCHSFSPVLNLKFWFWRLWGSSGTNSYPIDPEEIVKARQKGLNRTSAADAFEEALPQFTHLPLLQTAMQQETLKLYDSPCWVKGFCAKCLPQAVGKHKLLHNVLWQQVRKQIDQNLATQAREYLTSGDLAIAVRYGTKDSVAGTCLSSDAICKYFLVAKMSLRPISAVLIHMVPETAFACSDPGDADMQFASLDVDDATGQFVMQTSQQLVTDLLVQQKICDYIICVNVLEHNPVHLGSNHCAKRSNPPDKKTLLVNWFRSAVSGLKVGIPIVWVSNLFGPDDSLLGQVPSIFKVCHHHQVSIAKARPVFCSVVALDIAHCANVASHQPSNQIWVLQT